MSKRQPRGDTDAKSTSVYLTAEERALWDSVSTELNLSKKDAMLEGLRMLRRSHNGSGEITAEQVLEWVRRRA